MNRSALDEEIIRVHRHATDPTPALSVSYVCVSSADQNTVRQLDALQAERTFTDLASARSRLEEMLAFLREDDTLRVRSMDRLARTLDDLRRIVRALTGKGVRVEFAKENLAFTGEDDPMATQLLSVMGAFAEFERAHDPRTPARGHRCGQGSRRLRRKPALAPEQVHALRERAADEPKSAPAQQPRDRLQLPARRPAPAS